MKKPPLALVKERFGSKDKLVEKLAGQLEPLEGESRDDLRTRLGKVSSAKLLKLLEAEEKVDELFGSKDKLVDEILKLERPGAKKADEDYRLTLSGRSKAQLLSQHAAATRRAKRPPAASGKRGSAGRKARKRKAS